MNHDNRAVEQSASEALGPAEIEVVSGMGAKRFDANSIAIAAFTEDLSKLPPAPGLLSEISDEPAIRYRTQDVTLHLTPGELQRIVMRSLTPAELFAACRTRRFLRDSRRFLRPRQRTRFAAEGLTAKLNLHLRGGFSFLLQSFGKTRGPPFHKMNAPPEG
ncbi:hypothetical protein QZN30_05835 [Burkholderia multivorans]|nr:hypothetical protein [Burkholderia multivorans]